MYACPRCWEVIEQPTGFSEGAVLQEQNVAAAPPAEQTYYEQGYYDPTTTTAGTLTQEAPVVVYEPHVPVVRRDRRKLRPGRVVAIGLVAGLLLAIGLVALESFAPRLRGDLPEQVELSREAFPDLEFAIDAPKEWVPQTETIGGRPAVVFLAPTGDVADGNRGFQVVVDKRSYDAARTEADRGSPADEINIVDGVRLDGRRTFRHLYEDGEEYREAWWVQRGSGTYRIEFWSPLSRREENALLNVRIARTFDVL